MPILLILGIAAAALFLYKTSATGKSAPVTSFLPKIRYTLVMATPPGSPPMGLTMALGTVAEHGAKTAGAFTLGTTPTAPSGTGVFNGNPVDEYYFPIVAQKSFNLADLQSDVEAVANDAAAVVGAMGG
jgi:hypothetical protein